MMLATDLLVMSCHNLLLHKVRSLLTSLGVIFGVGSVIAMLAVSEGAKRSALEKIEAMGTDKIIIYSHRPPPEGKSEGSDNASVVERYGLTGRNLEHIVKMDNVANVTSLFDVRKKILRGLTRTDIKLIGCDFNFLDDTTAKMERGRWFSPADFANKSNVCVIGKNVKPKLFALGKTDIVGSQIRVEDALYTIIGVMNNEYSTEFQEIGGQNDMILIPMPTARARYLDYTYNFEGRRISIARIEYDVFIVRVCDVAFIDHTSKRIAGYLEKSHGDVRDWGMVVPLELLKQMEDTQNIFTIVMGSIAGISLVVGGIGIMNIMLANVYERRKEIGTRRALGAQKADILLQFLIETVFLTTSGGIAGIAVGVGIGRLITHYSGMPTVYSLWSIVLSLAISCMVGVIFGTYPAYKAAQQNPITVLRAE